MQEISPVELKNKDLNACVLLDVRTPAEFAAFHMKGAVNLPLDKLRSKSSEVLSDKDREVVVLCRSGGRAKQASNLLSEMGFARVFCVQGGTMACEQMGLEIVKGEGRVISLERQVRIVAGSMVLLGVILGSLLSPVFYGLSGFVGAGLVFAGITDWCGMGMLLARMPWNQRVGGGASCQLR